LNTLYSNQHRTTHYDNINKTNNKTGHSKAMAATRNHNAYTDSAVNARSWQYCFKTSEAGTTLVVSSRCFNCNIVFTAYVDLRYVSKLHAGQVAVCEKLTTRDPQMSENAS